MVQAVAWVAFSMVKTSLVAAASLVLVGIASMTATVLGASARQSLTPDRLLGRTSGGTRFVGLGAAGMGALMSGAVAALGTLTAPLLLAAALSLAFSVMFWFSARTSASAKKLRQHD
jgi:hypothetical protein